jgi:hypothetical protein
MEIENISPINNLHDTNLQNSQIEKSTQHNDEIETITLENIEMINMDLKNSPRSHFPDSLSDKRCHYTNQRILRKRKKIFQGQNQKFLDSKNNCNQIYKRRNSTTNYTIMMKIRSTIMYSHIVLKKIIILLKL